MSNQLLVNVDNHRSRQRIKELGEVFTPDVYVKQMLNQLDPKLWSNEAAVFFEPTCGHGNFVTAILERRINGLSQKYLKERPTDHRLAALANALATLWAIDIDATNIHLTRTRVAHRALLSFGPIGSRPGKKLLNYLSHVICTIHWQIHENETLSSLSDDSNAMTIASQTIIGEEWLSVHRHKPIDFEMNWCEFYSTSKERGVEPLLFQRASSFIQSIFQGNSKRANDFSFAKDSLQTLLKDKKVVLGGVT